MIELILMIYFLIFVICFYIGANLAKKNRGRYVDKPNFEFAPDITFKLAIGCLGSLLYLYIAVINKESIDIKLLVITCIFSFIIITYQVLVQFLNKLYIKKLEKSKESEENDDESPTDNNETVFVNDIRKEIFAFMDTAVCNGSELVLLVFSIVLLIMKALSNFGNNTTDIFNDIINHVGMGNLAILVLSDGIILIVFAFVRFWQFVLANEKGKKKDEYSEIVRFINDDVDN